METTVSDAIQFGEDCRHVRAGSFSHLELGENFLSAGHFESVNGSSTEPCRQHRESQPAALQDDAIEDTPGRSQIFTKRPKVANSPSL